MFVMQNQGQGLKGAQQQLHHQPWPLLLRKCMPGHYHYINIKKIEISSLMNVDTYFQYHSNIIALR